MENTSEKNDGFDCYEKLFNIYHKAYPMTQQPRTEMYKHCHKNIHRRIFRAYCV